MTVAPNSTMTNATTRAQFHRRRSRPLRRPNLQATTAMNAAAAA